MDKKTMSEKFFQFLDSLGVKTKDADEVAEEAKKEGESKKEEEKEKTKDEDKLPLKITDEDPLPKKVFDDGMADFDARLKRIEDMLAELLSEEDAETEDAESEEKIKEEAKKEGESEEEEKKEKTKDAEEEKEKEEEEKREKKEVEDAWPDFISHADVLVPGIQLKKPTKDHRKKMDSLIADVLTQASRGEDRNLIEPIIKVKDLKLMTTDALGVAFMAASQIVTISRNGKVQTKDASQLSKKGIHQFDTAANIANINKMNRERYAPKAEER